MNNEGLKCMMIALYVLLGCFTVVALFSQTNDIVKMRLVEKELSEQILSQAGDLDTQRKRLEDTAGVVLQLSKFDTTIHQGIENLDYEISVLTETLHKEK